MSNNIKRLLNKRSQESQMKIQKSAEKMLLKYQFDYLRKQLGLSQTSLARLIGVSQQEISKIENSGYELKLSTMKDYIEALGGKLYVEINLPNEKVIKIKL